MVLLRKILSVFRTEEGIIVERKNEFGTPFKKVFESEGHMLDYLGVYKTTGAIADYQLNVSDEFRSLVTNHFNS